MNPWDVPESAEGHFRVQRGLSFCYSLVLFLLTGCDGQLALTPCSSGWSRGGWLLLSQCSWEAGGGGHTLAACNRGMEFSLHSLQNCSKNTVVCAAAPKPSLVSPLSWEAQAAIMVS